MAQTHKRLRRARKRDRMRGLKSCGHCGCCPCNQVGCEWCPSDGRRRGETVRAYAWRWFKDRYPDDYHKLSDRKRKAGRLSPERT